MLNKNKSRRTGLWKYGFSAPLFVIMLIFSAASVATEKTDLIAGAEKLISPLKTDKDLTIVSTSEPAEQNSDKKISSVTKSEQITSVNKNTQEDFSALWTHVKKNIIYPASAKLNNITGYEVVYFKIQSGKISNVKIAKGLQNDIDNEVLRTFNLFKDNIKAEDNIYSLAIQFQLAGVESKNEVLPPTGKNYFLGSIVVTAQPTQKNTIFSPPLIINKSKTTDNEEIKNFSTVEVLPEFPGGMKGWGEYLQTALKYPAEARKNNITGRVILSFVVLKNGTITDIKVLRGIGGGADEEAIRVVKESPKWKPGLIKGEPVNVAYTMPIFFQLASKATEENN